MLEKIRTIGEYILAALLMLGGVSTASSWQSQDALSQQFFTPYVVLAFGIAFFLAGAGIVWGKVRKRPVLEGYSLYIAFLLLLFSLILEVTVYIAVSDWWDNLIITLFALVLRVSYFIKEGVKHDARPRRLRNMRLFSRHD